MDKIIGLKDFRQSVPELLEKVRKGQSFIVVRRSKPVFRISPPHHEERWEEVADFTKIKKGGVKIRELLSRL